MEDSRPASIQSICERIGEVSFITIPNAILQLSRSLDFFIDPETMGEFNKMFDNMSEMSDEQKQPKFKFSSHIHNLIEELRKQNQAIHFLINSIRDGKTHDMATKEVMNSEIGMLEEFHLTVENLHDSVFVDFENRCNEILIPESLCEANSEELKKKDGIGASDSILADNLKIHLTKLLDISSMITHYISRLNVC